MGQLKLSKNNVEAVTFNFDTSEIFSKATELGKILELSKGVYCTSGQCYDCESKQCFEIRCHNVNCNQVKCNQVKCNQVQCNITDCYRCIQCRKCI